MVLILAALEAMGNPAEVFNHWWKGIVDNRGGGASRGERFNERYELVELGYQVCSQQKIGGRGHTGIVLGK